MGSYVRKMIKTRLRSRLTDVTLAKQMRIAIEGPEQSSVNFEEALEVFKGGCTPEVKTPPLTPTLN